MIEKRSKHDKQSYVKQVIKLGVGFLHEYILFKFTVSVFCFETGYSTSSGYILQADFCIE